jgi:hypothetical protein
VVGVDLLRLTAGSPLLLSVGAVRDAIIYLPHPSVHRCTFLENCKRIEAALLAFSSLPCVAHELVICRCCLTSSGHWFCSYPFASRQQPNTASFLLPLFAYLPVRQTAGTVCWRRGIPFDLWCPGGHLREKEPCKHSERARLGTSMQHSPEQQAHNQDQRKTLAIDEGRRGIRATK